MRQCPSVERLAEELTRLPGIGPKTAERLTHHLLRVSESDAVRLADAIRDVKSRVRFCGLCFNLCEGAELCGVCSDPSRDATTLCVVEQPSDLEAIERTSSYRGVYHVLQGRVSPLDGVTPDQLTIEPLMDRVRRGEVAEVIVATNPTLEGEGTALHLSNLLAETSVRVTRLARGLASGISLEFANRAMLEDALSGRRDF